MSRNIDRQESLRIAAEKIRLKKEKEEREDKEFYERITSGLRWLFFKSVVVFCTLVALVTTIDTFVDGPTKKLSEKDWKYNREWERRQHKIIDVEGYMFSPTLGDWIDRDKKSLEITYSPIFRAGKKLNFDVQDDNGTRIKRQEETRQRSIFTWFPVFQLFLLIPLFTYFYKRQTPAFNFLRLISLVFVFPGTVMAIYYAIY